MAVVGGAEALLGAEGSDGGAAGEAVAEVRVDRRAGLRLDPAGIAGSDADPLENCNISHRDGRDAEGGPGSEVEDEGELGEHVQGACAPHMIANFRAHRAIFTLFCCYFYANMRFV